MTGQEGGLAAAGAARRPSALALLFHIVRYQNRIFLRNPFSAFFSLAFPLMFLLLFGSLFGREPIPELPGYVTAQFLTPSILVFAVVSTSYINLTTVVAINRDEGVLKRIRGMPVPGWVYLSGRVVSAVWWSLVAGLLQVVAGVLLFDVHIVWHLLPAAIVTVLVGIACFCALGMAVAAVIPNGETAPAVANFTALPLLFLSGVFIPLDNAPEWVRNLALLFPVRPFYLAQVASFNPNVAGPGFHWGYLGIVLLWAAAGAFVAVRFFQWEPRGSVRPRR